MGEGTEDRRQVCGKCVVQEPGLEKGYVQPLLTLPDELLAWDPVSGDSRIMSCTEGGSRLRENRTGWEFRVFAWSRVYPRECRQLLAFFSSMHTKEPSVSKHPDKLVYRQRMTEGDYVWVEAVAIAAGNGGAIPCYVRDMGKEEQKRYMQEQIIDRYVYRNCNFFLCSDGGTGYYEML